MQQPQIVTKGKERKINMDDIQSVLKKQKPSTVLWMRQAKSYVDFANKSGAYNELAEYLHKSKILGVKKWF